MENYTKYRWFLTKKENLVVGGKNSKQNDELLSSTKKSAEHDFIVMHTKEPGSPFSIIFSENPSESEIKEAAIFTACFSKAWKSSKKTAEIDIFKLSKIYKTKAMKQGTWGVKEKVKTLKVNLNLSLVIQKEKLRAVPIESVNSKKDAFFIIKQGKSDKMEIAEKIYLSLNKKFSKEEILSALPAGGIGLENVK